MSWPTLSEPDYHSEDERWYGVGIGWALGYYHDQGGHHTLSYIQNKFDCFDILIVRSSFLYDVEPGLREFKPGPTTREHATLLREHALGTQHICREIFGGSALASSPAL